MKLPRKTVALLIGGGSALLDRDGNVREVKKARDVGLWIRSVPELNLLADVQASFVFSGEAQDVQPQWWSTIAKTIAQAYREVDGFVVTQPVETIPHTAAALSLMLQNLGKPVIVTGAVMPSSKAALSRMLLRNQPSVTELGIRANLINAVQVATLDLGEVAVLYGNQLLRGGTVLRQPNLSFSSFGSTVPPLGRADFGLKLAPHRRRRSSSTVKLMTKILPNIMVVALEPWSVLPNLEGLTKRSVDGILVTGHAMGSLDHILNRARRENIPVGVVVSGSAPRRGSHVVVLSRLTPTMAVVKFMWALGQTKDHRTLQALLDRDIAGEHLSLSSPRP